MDAVLEIVLPLFASLELIGEAGLKGLTRFGRP